MPETDDRPKPTYALAAWLYPRALAIVTVIAFVSIWVQIDGLFGDGGIAPVSDFVSRLDAGDVSFFELPTLLRFAGSAGFMKLLAAVGVVASATLFAGVLPRTSLLVAWACYLSIVNAGFPFMAFQWDILLCEVLLASVVFVAPVRIDRREASPPPALAQWVPWLLLFRLMFRSGVVKLASGDEAWANLTALSYHYETQPLPTVFGWYAHQLPMAFQKVSCVLMFVVELVLPFLIFIPRAWARRTAAAGFTSLMLLIFTTGNYGFFNLLTLVLTLTLLDDRFLALLLPKWLLRWREARPEAPARAEWQARARNVGAGVLIGIASVGFLGGLFWIDGVDPLSPLRPLRSFNDYGLFAVMTTTRPEVQIEGSQDGESWRPYVFRYKVGPLGRAPVWNNPHQPRLDWQMWFAALGDYRQNPWLIRLMQRLGAQDPDVLGLMEGDPFEGEEPPRYMRARLFDYRMTTTQQKAASGDWWTRELLGPYTPILTLH